MTWQDRQALRQHESTLILASLQQWLESRPLQEVLPKSDFAEAVRYLRNHWEALPLRRQRGLGSRLVELPNAANGHRQGITESFTPGRGRPKLPLHADYRRPSAASIDLEHRT